ncbi:putative plastid lipid-associated protein/fibrillin [Rosa chinensis]|uniref:Putative plastid lipid-associated protein/fibrillin n=1 Tax=Rosa chinensis TaxID=74649 RepID=A0A2P6PAI7_ROSCH|nr:plastoglobulin-1, chloroplastic [Rosa chinensis]PRQ18935.1 putative plastid lipid-associated protein/fibrillin [Rosa chinensis]
MALNLVFTSHSSLLSKPLTFPTPKPQSLSLLSLSSPNPNPKLSSFRPRSSLSDDTPTDGDRPAAKITDEWGEVAEPEPEPESTISESDPPVNEDEWGGADEAVEIGNGTPAKAEAESTEEVEEVDSKLTELKRCLVDTFYGTELGFRAGSEVRAEVVELVNQLEAANPTPAPTENPGLLDGNWVLLYTASSELLPLLAAGSTSLLKVDKINQSIDTSSQTILNTITLSGPFATFSFSASASFEVRSPSRIQVQFKEGTFQPPDIKSSIDLPQDVEIFGQRINLSPIQQTLSPLQEVVASISRTISGQQSLKVPIPGERTQSWLLTTYLDGDLRISRGDGGLFVLAKEGSPLLDQ